jgi:hypothetical protein
VLSRPGGRGLIALNSFQLLSCPAVIRGEVDQGTIEPGNGAIRRACENRGARSDRIERRLQIARRPGDYAKDFGRGGLLLQGLVTLGCALGKLTLQIGYEPLGIG